jgi:hypothetical protein
MKLTLPRTSLKPKATFGSIFVDGVFECVTLEDVVRDLKADGSGKIFAKTAIPAGTYDVVIDFSQRFQKMMLHILNVPWFTGIRIHSLNTDLQTEGCVGVGEKVVGDDLITGGSVTLPKLFVKVEAALKRGEKVTITITDDFKTQSHVEGFLDAGTAEGGGS